MSPETARFIRKHFSPHTMVTSCPLRCASYENRVLAIVTRDEYPAEPRGPVVTTEANEVGTGFSMVVFSEAAFEEYLEALQKTSAEAPLAEHVQRMASALVDESQSAAESALEDNLRAIVREELERIHQRPTVGDIVRATTDDPDWLSELVWTWGQDDAPVMVGKNVETWQPAVTVSVDAEGGLTAQSRRPMSMLKIPEHVIRALLDRAEGQG